MQKYESPSLTRLIHCYHKAQSAQGKRSIIGLLSHPKQQSPMVNTCDYSIFACMFIVANLMRTQKKRIVKNSLE